MSHTLAHSLQLSLELFTMFKTTCKYSKTYNSQEAYFRDPLLLRILNMVDRYTALVARMVQCAGRVQTQYKRKKKQAAQGAGKRVSPPGDV